MMAALHQRVADRACAGGLPIVAAAVADIDRYLADERRAAPIAVRGCMPEDGPVCRCCGQALCDHSDPVFAGVIPSPPAIGSPLPIAPSPAVPHLAAGEVVFIGVDFAQRDHEDDPVTSGSARS